MTNPLRIDVTPSEGDLNALAARTKEIYSCLPRLPAPVIVEFSGSPKSGKSTNIDIIHHFFKRSEFNVWAPTEGASKRTPYNLRRDLVAFNAWSLNYAISELLLSFHNVDKPHLVLLDRGPFDSLAWMGVLRDNEKLTDEEYQTIKNFALHPKWAPLVDRVYLFTCTPEISLNRETAHKLTVRSGIAMNSEMLSAILAKYKNLEEELGAYPVRTVNTDNDDFGAKNSSYAIVSDILDCFSSKMETQL